MTDNINAPHGGTLIDLLASEARKQALREQSKNWASLDLTQRQLCDLELLLNGGFSPLQGFMNQADYQSVVNHMRLANSTVWPMPINLDVSEAFAKDLKKGQTIALRDPEGVMLAALTIAEIYRPDLKKEAQLVFGTTDQLHPGVHYLLRQTQPVYISGKLEGLQLPTHYDFTEMRFTPAELRALFAKRGWNKTVAFQTRNPMHRAHVEMTLRAGREVEANLLIQPTVGMTKPGDIDHFTRVRVYKALQSRFPSNTTMIALLPLAMRMGGPREALWHAIIRKNYGASHFIVGRDHAGPGKNSSGNDFYGPYDAQELVEEYASEVGITVVPFKMMVYVPSKDTYMPIDEVPEGLETANISGTEQRERLRAGKELPEWFTYPEVAAELHRTTPPRFKQGFSVFFTGLSGSGKSTIANVLITKLLELGGRSVTLLDGDIVRKHLSSELGFSKEHRDINIRRIGFVASEIAKHGGIAICAPIAPYDVTRKAVRHLVEGEGGGFVLAYVSTPLDVCEQRDRKGLYAKARSGEIKEFTGISDPYEVPGDADITLDTTNYSVDELAQQLLLHLEHEGYIGSVEDNT
ncbi:MAG TPA: bifunctional sulfate adenylyltransferase/adenylylsulfate kinase [Candidatus Saccharimonadales bacterium]|nr:bifunctional sulfate adenylyltransferase/adenylylsulfate kinase [Candidatus Saccharimonadales bacterium]